MKNEEKTPLAIKTRELYVPLELIWEGKLSTIEEYVEVWNDMLSLQEMTQWAKGEMANQVHSKYGEKTFKEFARMVKENPKTLNDYRRAVRAFPDPVERNRDLFFYHYVVASYTDSYNKKEERFESDNRFEWIEKADLNHWSVSRLAVEIEKAKMIKDGQGEEEIYFDYVEKFEHIFDQWDFKKIKPEKIVEIITKLKAMINKLENLKTGVMDGEIGD
jgi:hypothetical protein